MQLSKKSFQNGHMWFWIYEAFKYQGQELSHWKDKKLQRQCMERAFGMLVGKWGIFWQPLWFSPEINGYFITVCCKLHNLCLENKENSSIFL